VFTKTVMNISSALPPPQQPKTSPSTSSPPRAEYTCVLGTTTVQRRIQTMKARGQLIKRISASRRSEVLWRKQMMSKQRAEALNMRKEGSNYMPTKEVNEWRWVAWKCIRWRAGHSESVLMSQQRQGSRSIVPPCAHCPFLLCLILTCKPKANTKTQQTQPPKKPLLSSWD